MELLLRAVGVVGDLVAGGEAGRQAYVLRAGERGERGPVHLGDLAHDVAGAVQPREGLVGTAGAQFRLACDAGGWGDVEQKLAHGQNVGADRRVGRAGRQVVVQLAGEVLIRQGGGDLGRASGGVREVDAMGDGGVQVDLHAEPGKVVQGHHGVVGVGVEGPGGVP